METLVRAEGDSYWLVVDTGSKPTTNAEKKCEFVLHLLLLSVDSVITQRLHAGKTSGEKTDLTKTNAMWKAIKEYCTSATGGSEI